MSVSKAYCFNIAAMLIFGSVGIFASFIDLSSAEIVASRTVLGSLFLIALLVIRSVKINLQAVKNNLLMLILSGIALGLNWLFLFSAYKYTTVSVATLLYYCAPIIVIFTAPILLREKLTAPKIIGVIATIIGMICVTGTQTGGADPKMGVIYGILAAILYASVILLNKRITNIATIEKTLIQMLVAGVLMVSYAIYSHVGSFSMPTGFSLVSLLIIGFVHTGLAYLLYISSISVLKGQSVALMSYIDPASALIFSAVFLSEKLSFIQLIGAALILGGSAFGELYIKKKQNR